LDFHISRLNEAQTSETDRRDKFTFGVKAGANYSNVWDEQGQDFNADARVGFEMLVSQKGFQANGTLLGQPYSFTRTTTYLDIPLQLQIKPIEYLTIVAGPQYSYLFNQKDVYTFGSNSVAQEQEFNNDNIRKNILGFVAGGDINISHVVISGRIGWDFQTNNGDGTSTTPRYKNKWVQFTIGFKI
jgi:hypothetical protein